MFSVSLSAAPITHFLVTSPVLVFFSDAPEISNIVLAHIRPASGPCEIHASQMWAGSGPTLLAVWKCCSAEFLACDVGACAVISA